ncbi:MAG: hypothetical protein U0736_01625 [Gemmataceae bacterium]
MALVCPRCSNLYDMEGPCPRCGASFAVSDVDPSPPSFGPRWQQTVWGRVAIGLILAQGLFYALRHLLVGALLATSSEETPDVHKYLFLLQSFQVTGVLLGGALAGGAQRSGVVLGMLVGVLNAVLAVVFRQMGVAADLVGQTGPLLTQAIVGAIGGWIGMAIWAPVPRAAVPGAFTPKKPARKPSQPLFAGRVAWVRVALGTALAVAGTLSASYLFDKLLDLGHGKLGTSDELQDLLITWEIKALAVLLGAAFAGATTTNGLKQGLVVGLAGSLILAALQTPRPGAFLQLILFTCISTMSLSLAGGWFGGQLFPPVVKWKRPTADVVSW